MRYLEEQKEFIRQEKINKHFKNLKEKAENAYFLRRKIYGFYKDNPNLLIDLVGVEMATELLNIKIESKKNRSQKKVRLFCEKLNNLIGIKE